VELRPALPLSPSEMLVSILRRKAVLPSRSTNGTSRRGLAACHCLTAHVDHASPAGLTCRYPYAVIPPWPAARVSRSVLVARSAPIGTVTTWRVGNGPAAPLHIARIRCALRPCVWRCQPVVR
jgi:hypothetical protein